MEETFDQLMDGFGDHDLTRFGRLQEACCDVCRVADRGVVHAQIGSDAAHDDQSGIESLADLELDAAVAFKLVAIGVQRPPNAERRLDRTADVVLVSDRRSEQCHDSITEKLIHSTFITVNLGEHQFEGPSHQPMNDLRVEPVR